MNKVKTLTVLLFTVLLGSSVFPQDRLSISQFKEELLSFNKRPIKWEGLSPTKPADGFVMENERIFAVNDSLVRININPADSNYIPPERFKTRIPQSLYGPAALIVLGLTSMGGSGLYSSHQARTDLLNLTKGKGGPIDDYLVVAPYAEFGILLLFKIQCRNDFRNTALLIVKSEALMLAMVYSLKWLTHEERPYSYQQGLDGSPLADREKSTGAFQSFPSGHTAEAFVAATIVYREYRYISRWYGIGAYALATTVGVFRMVNDQHWMSDVLVGAGIGMLATNIVYATHQHRWGRNSVCVLPMYNGQEKGVVFTYNF